MTERNTAAKGTRRSAKRTDGEASGTFTDEEKAAARERVKELKRSPRAGKADGERDVLEKISEMEDADRVMAERIHAIVTATAPELAPKTWYGMPAYARSDSKLICFFKSADKFKSRYATFGFEEEARLDDGEIWPTSWALTKLTPAAEQQIVALVKKAAS